MVNDYKLIHLGRALGKSNQSHVVQCAFSVLYRPVLVLNTLSRQYKQDNPARLPFALTAIVSAAE